MLQVTARDHRRGARRGGRADHRRALLRRHPRVHGRPRRPRGVPRRPDRRAPGRRQDHHRRRGPRAAGRALRRRDRRPPGRLVAAAAALHPGVLAKYAALVGVGVARARSPARCDGGPPPPAHGLEAAGVRHIRRRARRRRRPRRVRGLARRARPALRGASTVAAHAGRPRGVRGGAVLPPRPGAAGRRRPGAGPQRRLPDPPDERRPVPALHADRLRRGGGRRSRGPSGRVLAGGLRRRPVPAVPRHVARHVRRGALPAGHGEGRRPRDRRRGPPDPGLQLRLQPVVLRTTRSGAVPSPRRRTAWAWRSRPASATRPGTRGRSWCRWWRCPRRRRWRTG